LVHEAVDTYGLAALGAVTLLAGLLQTVLGLLRLGRWFRAISLAVVQGMLAGIGLVIVLGQVYALADTPQPSGGLRKIAELPSLAGSVASGGAPLTAFITGAGTVAVLILWPKLPARLRVVPGALAAVALSTAATALLGLDLAMVDISGLLQAVDIPGSTAFGALGGIAAVGTVLAFALIASAESLFSAAAVDRMHDGPRTDYDKELLAQGIGNTVSGALGALPLTAVIVRSAANVQAGARTSASRVLHGLWLLLFAALLPNVLSVIPLTALAGVLVHAGAKLIPVKDLAPLWREHRGEAMVLVATTTCILVTNLFEGVLFGLLLSLVKTAWDTSRLHIEVRTLTGGRQLATLTGNATFLRLPRLLEQLESLPTDQPIELDLTGLRHLDHACRSALDAWASRHPAVGTDPVRIRLPVPS
jgi:MFS superfamily sulfate permease-like transporter